MRFADAHAAALLREHVETLRDPEAAGWTRVKRNASRTVYRGSIAGVEIYVKQFHPRAPLHRLAQRVGVSGALRELHWATVLRERGVETPLPLAAQCHASGEWVATRAVLSAQPADEWHEEQLRHGTQGLARIQQALAALAGLIGRMHAAGIMHEDLHCGNVLIREEGEVPHAVLMDLHRVSRRGGGLSRRLRAKNLAHLLHDRSDFTTRSQRLRFLKHYLRESGAGGTLRGWQLLVEHMGRRHTRGQLASRDRRVVGRNKYFSPLRLPGGWRGHVVLASKRVMAGSRAGRMQFTREGWQAVLGDVDGLLQGEGVEVVKDSPSGTVVRRRIEIDGQGVDVYIKRPRRKQWWKLLSDCFRPSRPLRAFVQGHQLLARRIGTALPLAAMERRVGPFLLDSILVTETVDAPVLDTFLRTWLTGRPRNDIGLTVPQQRHLAQEVLWQLGRMVQRLHDSGFAHRDLKAANVLVRWGCGDPPEIVLIDLDGLARRWHLGPKRRFQGLMRLNVSLLQCPEVNHAGRLRMLLGYLRRPGSGRIRFKPYWRVLEQWSDRKIGRQIRSRRRRQKAVRRPQA